MFLKLCVHFVLWSRCYKLLIIFCLFADRQWICKDWHPWCNEYRRISVHWIDWQHLRFENQIAAGHGQGEKLESIFGYDREDAYKAKKGLKSQFGLGHWNNGESTSQVSSGKLFLSQIKFENILCYMIAAGRRCTIVH